MNLSQRMMHMDTFAWHLVTNSTDFSYEIGTLVLMVLLLATMSAF